MLLGFFPVCFFFFFNDTATTEIYTLSLHDALPICIRTPIPCEQMGQWSRKSWRELLAIKDILEKRYKDVQDRSEEHTSELQSHLNIVCRLLLEKKNDVAL